MLRKSVIVFLALAVASPAFATPTSAWVSDWLHPYEWMTEGETHTVTHDLVDYGVPSERHVTHAAVMLAFADDDRDWEWSYDWKEHEWTKTVGKLEHAYVHGAGMSALFEVDGSHWFGFDFRWVGVGDSGIDSLNENGQLHVSVTAVKKKDGVRNDFWWKKSALFAKLEHKQVPEPGTLALLGSGLLGLGWMSRRRRSA